MITDLSKLPIYHFNAYRMWHRMQTYNWFKKHIRKLRIAFMLLCMSNVISRDIIFSLILRSWIDPNSVSRTLSSSPLRLRLTLLATGRLEGMFHFHEWITRHCPKSPKAQRLPTLSASVSLANNLCGLL